MEVSERGRLSSSGRRGGWPVGHAADRGPLTGLLLGAPLIRDPGPAASF